MRWSRLKQLLEENFEPALKMRIFCTVQRGERGSIGRYWIEQYGNTIFDEPKNVSHMLRENDTNDAAPAMTALMRKYLDSPKDNLHELEFPEDSWGLTEILKAADRRIGKRRLLKLKETLQNPAALKLVESRLKEAPDS